jgi:1-acyl-sn-glycerol-3-phosphate acyltransferase
MNGLRLSKTPFRGGRRRWFSWIMRNVARILLFPFFCLKTSGKENLPRKSAFVLLPKHQRWEDIPLLGLGSPRPLYYLAKNELFKNPLSNWFFRGLGGIPLNRERPLESREFLRAMIEILKRGEGFVVFPEGTYYRGRVGAARVGVIRLILSHLDLPFIPVGINYLRKGWRVVVTINFGKPVYADSRASASEFLDLVMADIAKLSGLRTINGCT